MSLPSRPSLFSKGDVATWLEKFGHIAAANSWKREDWAKLVPAYLDGQALAVFARLSDADKTDFDKMRLALLEAFRSPPQLAMTAFQTRRLRPDESVDEYAYHLRRLLADAMPALADETAQSAMLVHQFVAGLPENFRHKILELNQSSTMDAALLTAKRLLALQSSVAAATITQPPAAATITQPLAPALPPLAPALPPSAPTSQTVVSAMPHGDATRVQNQPHHLEHLTEALTQQMTLTSTLVETVQKMSEKLERFSQNVQGRTPGGRRSFNGICYSCGRYGHIKQYCPFPVASDTLAQRNTKRSLYTDCERSLTSVPANTSSSTAVYVNAAINGRDHRCMIDTGAGVSLVPPNFGNVPTDSRNSISLECANGSVIRTQGTTKLRVTLGGADTLHTFHVAAVTTGVILGADFLRSNGIDIRFSSRELTWSSATHGDITVPISQITPCCKVVLADDVLLTKQSSELVVLGELVDDRKVKVEEPLDGIFEPLPDMLEQTGVLPARALVSGSSGLIPVRLLNVQGPQKLYKGKTLGTVDAFISPIAAVSSDKTDRQKEWTTTATTFEPMSMIGSESALSSDEHMRLVDLLHSYADIFSTGSNDIGRTSVIRHSISTTTDQPIRQRQYRQHITLGQKWTSRWRR